jgi:hypothetical protein
VADKALEKQLVEEQEQEEEKRTET